MPRSIWDVLKSKIKPYSPRQNSKYRFKTRRVKRRFKLKNKYHFSLKKKTSGKSYYKRRKRYGLRRKRLRRRLKPKKRKPAKKLHVKKKRKHKTKKKKIKPVKTKKKPKKTKVKKPKAPIVDAAEVNISLDGYSFIAEDFKNKNSLARREINKTKIFNGGEVGSIGAYMPREFDFTTHLRVPEGKTGYYDDLFNYLMGKSVKVVSPLVGRGFSAYCEIERTLMKGTKNIILVEFKLHESAGKDLKIDNKLYSNKRLTIYDVENW